MITHLALRTGKGKKDLSLHKHSSDVNNDSPIFDLYSVYLCNNNVYSDLISWPYKYIKSYSIFVSYFDDITYIQRNRSFRSTFTLLPSTRIKNRSARLFYPSFSSYSWQWPATCPTLSPGCSALSPLLLPYQLCPEKLDPSPAPPLRSPRAQRSARSQRDVSGESSIYLDINLGMEGVFWMLRLGILGAKWSSQGIGGFVGVILGVSFDS